MRFKRWLQRQQEMVLNDWDNINLTTGREGTGKSTWMQYVAKRLDPKLTVENIHFEIEDFHEDVANLEPGRAIILDEFRGHRRLAMHGERTDFLDFVKECRGLRLHIFIGYPRITTFERDLVSDRLSGWSHLRVRGLVEVRKPATDLIFDREGQPIEPTKYPMVGHWRFKEDLVAGYKEKKAQRMKERAAGFLNKSEEKAQPPAFNEAAFREAVARMGKPAVNPRMLDEVQKELKRGP